MAKWYEINVLGVPPLPTRGRSTVIPEPAPDADPVKTGIRILQKLLDPGCVSRDITAAYYYPFRSILLDCREIHG